MLALLFLLSPAFGLKVFTRKFQPLSDCEGSGFEIELLKESLSAEFSDIEIICKDSVEEIMQELENSHDAVGVGALVIDGDYIREGFTYSVPTIRSGLNVLTKKANSNDYWWLIQIFDRPVWLLFLATPLLIGLFNWTLGMIVSNNPAESKSIETLLENIWLSYCFNFYNGSDDIRISRFLNVLLGATSSLLLYAYISSYFSFDFDDAMSNL